jgi:hypothetical protein
MMVTLVIKPNRQKKRKKTEREKERERKKKTTIGSQDEDDVILQVTIFSLLSLFFSRLIVLSRLTQK